MTARTMPSLSLENIVIKKQQAQTRRLQLAERVQHDDQVWTIRQMARALPPCLNDMVLTYLEDDCSALPLPKCSKPTCKKYKKSRSYFRKQKTQVLRWVQFKELGFSDMELSNLGFFAPLLKHPLAKLFWDPEETMKMFFEFASEDRYVILFNK